MLINNFYLLLKSFFQNYNNKFEKIIIIKEKSNYLSKDIIQIVEYNNYPYTRFKKLGSKYSYKCGLSSFLSEDLNFLNKVLIITVDCITDEISSELIDSFSFFDFVYIVINDGLDLGAHKRIHSYMTNNNLKSQTSVTLFTNSSFVPKSNFRIKELANITRECDVLTGVSYGYGPRYFIRKQFHIQTFFFIIRNDFASNIFNHLDISGNNKYRIIRNGELMITKLAFKNGLISLVYDGNKFILQDSLTYKFATYDHRIQEGLFN